MLAVVLTVLPIAAGVIVLGDGERTTSPPITMPTPPSYSSTALADYDTTVVAVTRAPFCDLLPEEALAEALGGTTGPMTSYDNGERAEVAPGVDDVAHEYGCRAEGSGGTEARAWLFAPPVTRSRAGDLVALAAERAGCRTPARARPFGAPSVALVCPSGDRRWASYRGLFGDAWLACSVAAPTSLPEADLVDRAGRWCVAVAQAAATPAG